MSNMKNYVCRKYDGFFLGRGEPLQEDKSLAIVKSWSEPIVSPRYSIIDIKSGLFVIRATTKKKLLEKWEKEKEVLLLDIAKARNAKYYVDRCGELEAEVHIWRESGYKVSYEL